MKVVIAVLLSLCLLTTHAFAFGLDDLTGGAEKGGKKGAAKKEKAEKKVDVDKLSKNATHLVLKVGVANMFIAEAAIDMLMAANKEKDAQQLQTQLDNMKAKKNDPEAAQQLTESNNNALKELREMDFEKDLDKEKARKAIPIALLKFGGAALFDALAVKDGENVVQETGIAVNAASANPFAYGMSALGTLKSSLSSGKFVVTSVTVQIKDIYGLVSNISKYAKANKIKVPSAKDTEAFGEKNIQDS